MSLKIEAHLWRALSAAVAVPIRVLSGGSAEPHSEEGGDEHSSFGVHIGYEDLYASIIFFTCIYVMGAIAQRFLKMPSLVGEIFAGILLGPPVANYVPNPVAFVMLGEIGLILLVLEAGIDIDLTTLKLIGARGIVIAIIGSILPIGIGIGIAFAIGTDVKGSIAAGAAFGPTSLGIAMNILRQGKLVNTPVGQLIVSAAVIDDMIALIILSQLTALTGTVNVVDIVVPIISALGFLVLGGYIAVYIAPGLIDRFILSRIAEEKHAPVSLALMLGLLLGLMPATYYCKASFLMGAFVAGLTFCRSHELHHIFVKQFKRILQWLMRIFFAASIGFQVPIKHFGNGTVVWQGILFTVALFGKIAVGFLVPNFNQTKRFTGVHFRDCLITGFSMAAEGEFAFVIAVFAVDSGIITEDLYASIVLAVLISTIIPPFLLRFTIAHYNKKAEEKVAQAAEFEFNRKMDLDSQAEFIEEDKNESLRQGIKNDTTVFLCIQTQSDSGWGLLTKIMGTMNRLKLEVIDHRSWHPRGVDTTLVNEVFAKDTINAASGEGTTAQLLDNRIAEVRDALLKTIAQEEAKVKVQRWFPGVLEEIKEEIEENDPTKTKIGTRLTLQESIMHEAATELEKKRDRQTSVTKERSVREILQDVELPQANLESGLGGGGVGGDDGGMKQRRPRRVRQKMRSTPVVGGGLFGERNADFTSTPTVADMRAGGEKEKLGTTAGKLPFSSGTAAELIVAGEVFKIRVSPSTLNRIRSGYSGSMVDDGSIHIDPSDMPVEHRLEGFVRNLNTLSTVAEETDMSEISEHESETEA